MKLTSVIIDLGRAVAYYPGLKKIIASTNAVIFLCQLLYWRDKTKDDGWIYKTSDEIEEETGLSYNEQRTAREKLVEELFIFEEYRRLDHRIHFKVNEDELNRRWEELTGKKSKEIISKKEEPKEEQKEEKKERESFEVPVYDSQGNVVRTRTTATKPQGDMVDGMLAFMKTPEGKRSKEIMELRNTLETKIRINTDTPSWERFYQFAHVRQEKYGEKLEDFLDWMLNTPNFNIVFWTPAKMKTVYPQAFEEIKKLGYREDFCPKYEDLKEDESEPMPEKYRKKKDIY